MTVGMFVGKFLPPHRGHLNAIFEAYSQVDRLYVVISYREVEDRLLCTFDGELRFFIPKTLRKQWMAQELQGFDNVRLVLVDESGIPPYPHGWKQWAELVRSLVKERVDVAFGGEQEYLREYLDHFPDISYRVIPPARSRWNMSSSKIRQNPLKHWDYICGSSRPFFAKKVLVSGTESCGKTTLTKMLAKIYHTSWAEEVGRYYARDYLGGDETIFTDEDFVRIAHLQYEADLRALRTANRIVFFDTDAVVTDYYSFLYMGGGNPRVESYVDPRRYDLVMLLAPDVPWVDDGQRLHGDPEERWRLHAMLKGWYERYGFRKIVEIFGGFSQKLSAMQREVDALLGYDGAAE